MGNCECLRRGDKPEGNPPEIKNFYQAEFQENYNQTDMQQKDTKVKETQLQPKQKNFTEKRKHNEDIISSEKKQKSQTLIQYDQQQSKSNEKNSSLIEENNEMDFENLPSTQNVNLMNTQSIISQEGYFSQNRGRPQVKMVQKQIRLSSQDSQEDRLYMDNNSFLLKSDFSDVNSNQNFNKGVRMINNNDRETSNSRERYSYKQNIYTDEDSLQIQNVNKNISYQDYDQQSEGGTSSQFNDINQSNQTKVKVLRNENTQERNQEEVLENYDKDMKMEDEKQNIELKKRIEDKILQKYNMDKDNNRLSYIIEVSDEQLRQSYQLNDI